jgi:hypothetical protein
MRALTKVEENTLRENGIDLTIEYAGEPVRILVEKDFLAIDDCSMKEITTHIEAIRDLGGGWKVSCKLR